MSGLEIELIILGLFESHHSGEREPLIPVIESHFSRLYYIYFPLYCLSLAELIILRYLTDNRRISMSKIEELIQGSHELAQKNCNSLIKDGLIEVSGREYMLTAKTYEAVKTAVDYTKDKSIQYIKAKEMILEYIRGNDSITNEKTRELCGFTKQQARMTIDKMRKENLIELRAAGKKSCYVLCK
jgi:ATP-dependent DNA helicase RecG